MKLAITGVVVGLVVSGFSVSSAFAAAPYVSGSAGVAMPGDSGLTARSYDTGYNLAGAAGIDGGRYRLEVELGHQNNKVHGTGASESMTTYMGNGYIDLELPFSPLKPFVIAGVGFSNVHEDDGFGRTAGDMVFAWQFGGGAGFSVAPWTTLDAQYRYFATSSAELAGNHGNSISTHKVMLGLRLSF